jgi:enoyl-CoA hydratase/carnithine racemase
MKQTRKLITQNTRQYKKWTKWEIESIPFENKLKKTTQEIIHVTMNTNKVNAFSTEFLSDLHGCMDVLKHDFPPECPVTFRSSTTTFSAGV